MNGPGSYEIHDNFGHNLNSLAIGVRRENPIQSVPGPGTYSPEKGDALIMTRAAAYDFGKQPERPN
jgi:hypothetical protein